MLGAMVFAFGTVFLEERPPALMVFSQAFQACILPAVAVPMFVLINRQKLMGNNRAGLKLNLGLIAVILFSLLTTWFAISEFI
jgi:Mn2+/Fe2+ NRAMP family transporter